MRCSEFLEIYSDYRDGLIADPDLARSVQRHLRHCTRCMDYDALVSRGVMALRATGEIRPNPLFVRRLERRVAALESAVRRGAAAADTATIDDPSVSDWAAADSPPGERTVAAYEHLVAQESGGDSPQRRTATDASAEIVDRQE